MCKKKDQKLESGKMKDGYFSNKHHQMQEACNNYFGSKKTSPDLLPGANDSNVQT